MRAPYECQPSRIQYVDKMRGEYTIVLSGCVIVCFNKNSVLFTLKTRRERENAWRQNQTRKFRFEFVWRCRVEWRNKAIKCVFYVRRSCRKRSKQHQTDELRDNTVVRLRKKKHYLWRCFEDTSKRQLFSIYTKKNQPKQNLNHRRDFSFERGKMFLMKEFKLMNINGSISINWKII